MIRTRKRFGQHLLEDAWADKLVSAIDPQADDRFIEIGPGTGALTLRLAPRVAHMTAVEIDRDMAARLRPDLPGNVALLEGDFLESDLAALVEGRPVRVAGNLPYNVSSPILFRLISAYREGIPLRDATVMLQREVAERLGAAPGSSAYGVLSISIGLYADVTRLLSLPPGAFRPAPRVHSAVVRLAFRRPAVSIADERLFEGMVRSLFTQRRKTIANALAPFATSRRLEPRAALRETGVDPGRRAETLQLAELARLADYFTERVP